MRYKIPLCPPLEKGEKKGKKREGFRERKNPPCPPLIKGGIKWRDWKKK